MGITENAEISLLDPYLDTSSGHDAITKFNNLKQKNRNLKTMVAVGGWNQGGQNFSRVANNPDLTKRFAKNALEFVLQHNFNGLDVDWEYPGQRGGSNNDKEAFNDLLREIQKT